MALMDRVAMTVRTAMMGKMENLALRFLLDFSRRLRPKAMTMISSSIKTTEKFIVRKTETGNSCRTSMVKKAKRERTEFKGFRESRALKELKVFRALKVFKASW